MRSSRPHISSISVITPRSSIPSQRIHASISGVTKVPLGTRQLGQYSHSLRSKSQFPAIPKPVHGVWTN
ncbi:hypothetical protein FOVSG1_001686 [Fusarium oxysporum f. sp. vasinfectum]